MFSQIVVFRDFLFAFNAAKNVKMIILIMICSDTKLLHSTCLLKKNLFNK